MARTQINKKASIKDFKTVKISRRKMGERNDIKITAENTHIIRILAYSAIKISANEPLLYSILNPDTNSDSPSAKSKGVRFVSARVVINQIKARGRRGKKRGNIWFLIINEKLKDKIKHNVASKINAILTSYEIVWATLRIAPNKAYFELDVHPEASVV